MLSTIIFTALSSGVLLFNSAEASCECGYLLKDTSDYYTGLTITDFASYSDTDAPLNTNSPDFVEIWGVQSYAMAASGTDAPLPRQNNPDNVYIEGGNLVLKQSAYSAADLAAGNPVQIAEIQSQATDYLHGSFRIKAKVDIDTAAAERGSVAGWFYYHDDTHEVDIEALTWEDPTTIHYTSQPSQANGEAVPGATKAQTLTTPWTSLAEHRFDWTSAGLNFFENSISNFVTTANIPAVGGPMLLNLWANGNSWSGTPSTSDVLWYIESITMYYNTTATDAGSDSTFIAACAAAGGKSNLTVCSA